MQVQVPAGVVAGQMMAVNTPTGQTMQVAVPAGVAPGQMIQVNVPAAAPAAVVATPTAVAVAMPAVATPAVAVATPAVAVATPAMAVAVATPVAVVNNAPPLQLKIFAKATVRESIEISSREVPPPLAPGGLVEVMQEGRDNGHMRAQIGEDGDVLGWISRVTAAGHTLAYQPTTPGASKLKLIELATIRSSRSVQSEKIGELAAGEFVVAHEECECDGHVRVRITPSPAAEQWISRVTGSGKQLAELQ
jgi:hypothetical protein